MREKRSRRSSSLESTADKLYEFFRDHIEGYPLWPYLAVETLIRLSKLQAMQENTRFFQSSWKKPYPLESRRSNKWTTHAPIKNSYTVIAIAETGCFYCSLVYAFYAQLYCRHECIFPGKIVSNETQQTSAVKLRTVNLVPGWNTTRKKLRIGS